MSTLATLSLPAFDVLWEDLGAGPIPYPFDIDQHGGTLDERARVKAAVHDDLERLGLLRRGRPEPDLEDALRLIARPGLRITVMGRSEAAELLRAQVVARRGYVVRAVQSDGAVRLDVLRGVSPAKAAVSVLPWCGAGPGKPVTVAASALEPAAPQGLLETVRSGGDDDVKAVRRMLAGPFTGTGHFTLTNGDAELAPVTWIDTPRGRYATVGRDWITVAPADRDVLAGRLSRALASPAP